MFTKISANNPLFQILSQIYSYIINRINWWMDNTDTVYIVIRVWLRTKRYQRIYASNMHDFVQFLCLKFHLNSVMCHSQVSPKETSTSISVTRFLLCFAWNWHLLQAIHEAISTIYCQETWLLLQRSFVALDWFFRFPQDNLESNSCITLMVIWHKIELFTTSLIFCKNSKNWFSRASGSEL